MQIAMTVGATKVQIIQENALAAASPQQACEEKQETNSNCEP